MMRAKKLKKKLRRFSFLFACTFCVLAVLASGQLLVAAWQGFLRPLLQPTSVVCVVNDVYSDKLIHEIKSAVQVHAANHHIVSFDAKKFFSELKKQFKCIKSLDYELQAPRGVKVSICGFKPKMVLNNSLVLSEKRRLFSSQDFCDASLCSLPQVTVDDRWCCVKLDEHVYRFLHNVPQKMLDCYSIHFKGKNAISLVPLQGSQSYKIITNARSFFDEKKLQQIDAVLADLITKNKISEQILAHRENGLIFDVRFDNKIYVRFLNKPKRGARR